MKDKMHEMDEQHYKNMSNMAHDSCKSPESHKHNKGISDIEEMPFTVGRGGKNWMDDSRPSGPGASTKKVKHST